MQRGRIWRDCYYLFVQMMCFLAIPLVRAVRTVLHPPPYSEHPHGPQSCQLCLVRRARCLQGVLRRFSRASSSRVLTEPLLGGGLARGVTSGFGAGLFSSQQPRDRGHEWTNPIGVKTGFWSHEMMPETADNGSRGRYRELRAQKDAPRERESLVPNRMQPDPP